MMDELLSLDMVSRNGVRDTSNFLLFCDLCDCHMADFSC